MKHITFSKMHGAGNDFVVIDATQIPVNLSVEDVRFLCDRHFGVGADQLLLVEPSSEIDIDFRYRIFNCDGHEVEQCGNGARCFAKFVRRQGLTTKDRIRVRTMKGVIEPQILADGRVRVDMGRPMFDWLQFPFLVQGLLRRKVHDSEQFALDSNQNRFWIAPVSMGNPTATIFVPEVSEYDVKAKGAALGAHPAFPRGANIAFLQIVNSNQASIRVYERGAGETLACGSGTCAAVVAAIQAGLCSNAIEVRARGGSLLIEWNGSLDSSVFLTGPAMHVFDGEITL